MLGNKVRLVLACLLPSGLALSASLPGSGALSLPMALEFAMGHSPEIAAARLELRVKEGMVLQARLPDNPEFTMEAENLNVTGAMKEETRTITMGFSQTVDLSCISRTSAAARERDIARLDLESTRLRIRIHVRQRFIAVISAQERLSLSEEICRIVRSAHGLAVEKVRAGKAAPMDSLQSFVALSLAVMDSVKAAEALKVARRQLSSACGNKKPDFDSAQGHLDAAIPPPEWKEIESKLNANPEWIKVESEFKLRGAEVRAEKAARLPPLTLEAGIRQVPDRDGQAFVAGVSLPLPIWNWNQGSIRSAEARKAKAGEEGKARRIEILDRLAEIHGQAVATYREAALLASAVLPAATAAFVGAQEAYRVGKFGSLETLNAQKALFEARGHYLDALTVHQSAMAELEEIINPNSGAQP